MCLNTRTPPFTTPVIDVIHEINSVCGFTVADPGLPRIGVLTTKMGSPTYYFAQPPPLNLYENLKNWTQREAQVPAPPLDPPLDRYSKFLEEKYEKRVLRRGQLLMISETKLLCGKNWSTYLTRWPV